ncbi:MAG: DUF4124 domain-containing protein [Glaciimonas sp.]|nr:DUF4124 domain-containing protein [Glaciimonas sp.]
MTQQRCNVLSSLIVASITAMLLPISAHAQIFSCKDAAGRTISSDRPMPECANRAVRELSANGFVKHEIPAPLNAEQKRQQQLKDEKRQAAAEALEQQRQQDKALLARYHSEDDITASRQYYLALSQDFIKRDRAIINDAEKQLEAVRIEAEFYKKKKVLPLALRNKIEDANRAIDKCKKNIAEHQTEAVNINAKFDDTVKRFRELTLGQKST